MSPTDAARYLDSITHLSAAERNHLLSQAGTKVQDLPTQIKIRVTDPRRAHLSATLWVLGLTYRRIGSLLGVSHTTVHTDVMQFYDQAAAPRMFTRTPFNRGVWYRDKYHENAPMLFALSPAAAAKWLHQQREQTPGDDDE